MSKKLKSSSAKSRAQDSLAEYEAFKRKKKKVATDLKVSKTLKKAEIATSKLGVERNEPMVRKLPVLEIDPFRCRPWIYHNRDTSWLNREGCQDLISSIASHGQQEPSLVRPLKNDPDFDYEIIYGVRRWFACKSIPNQKLIGRETNADDRECMILMHFENADSKDISEFERAISFKKHLDSGQFNSQKDLAESLHLSLGFISKCLSAAKILDYEWILPILPSVKNISIRKAYELSGLLKDKYNRNLIQENLKLIKIDGPAKTLKWVDFLIKSCDEEKNDYESFLRSLEEFKGLKFNLDSQGRLIVKVSPEVKKGKLADTKKAITDALEAFAEI